MIHLRPGNGLQSQPANPSQYQLLNQSGSHLQGQQQMLGLQAPLAQSVTIPTSAAAHHQMMLLNSNALDNTVLLNHQQQQMMTANSQTNKKNSTKNRGPNIMLQGNQHQKQVEGGISHGVNQGAANLMLLNATGGQAQILTSMGHQQIPPYNQTAKLPQNHFLMNTQLKPGQQQQQQQVMSALIFHQDGKSQLSQSQKKRINLKKQEVDQQMNATGQIQMISSDNSKTIEQVCSPNSSTLNLENMKKTQSLHYVRSGSGTSSPQQVKSRSSIGKYSQNPASVLGMAAAYNNYNNQALNQTNGVGTNGNGGQAHRGNYVSKSQIGGMAGMTGSMPSSATTNNTSNNLSGNRSRSKTTNRKKRNLYTSIGNYYQSQQQTNNPQQNVQNNNSASRVSKRLVNQNFLENLEQTNLLIGGNLAAHQALLMQTNGLQSQQEADIMNKKRNKSSTKSYNNKELLDHNNSAEMCYSSHIAKKNPLNNNFFEVSQFSSNHNSIAKNFDSSFQFNNQGANTGFLPNSGKIHNTSSTQGGGSLSVGVSANKQRPTSSHKSALMAAAISLNNSAQSSKGGVSQGVAKKKVTNGGGGNLIQGGTGTLRKSLNGPSQLGGNSSSLNSSNIINNNSTNYGHLQQNAYDFLTNASLLMNSSKAARRPKGSSAIDSRCSQNKDHNNNALGGLIKSQISSNTAFGHHQNLNNLNNTSHTTICSNRKIGLNGGEIVSGKKHSLQHQQQQVQSTYISLAGPGIPGTQVQSDILTAGEISSDRQTLKMNDFLKQIEAYSNDKLDKFMPQMTQAQQLNKVLGSSSSMGINNSVIGNGGGSVISNYGITQQAKIAEQIRNVIEREMSVITNGQQYRTTNSKRRYHQGQNIDESRGGGDSGILNNEEDEYEGENEPESPSGQRGGLQGPDYLHLLNVINESFNELIQTFFQQQQTFIVGQCLGRIKESYEEIINSIVENLSQQIENLGNEVEYMGQENHMIKERNAILEKQVSSQEKSTQQIDKVARQNEVLESELSKLFQENNLLKREQKDRDSQLMESQKIIEKLSASQKQLLTSGSNLNYHNNSQGSSLTAAVYNQSQKSQQKRVPLLDLGKIKIQQAQQQQQMAPPVQQMMSNDSLATLDKGLLNANIQDHPSQSSSMINTVPNHQDGSRILGDLYTNTGPNQNHHHHPFAADQSGISYQNSLLNGEDADEGEEIEDNSEFNPDGGMIMDGAPLPESAYHANKHGGPQAFFNHSGHQSSIAQDKSPLQKPFIPPLNLAGLNNRQQAARQNQQQQQQTPQVNQPQSKSQKFKLDLSNINPQAQAIQQINNSMLDQDIQGDYLFKQQETNQQQQQLLSQQQQPPKSLGFGGGAPTGLGLNLAALKQAKGIQDFQDEFMAKADEYSQSWRDALKREKRF